MLEPVRLLVHLMPRHVQHIDQQPLGEPVPAHHAGRREPAPVGQPHDALLVEADEALTLQACNGLRHSRGRDAEPLHQPRAHDGHAGLLELVNRLEVVLHGRRVLASDHAVDPRWGILSARDTFQPS